MNYVNSISFSGDRDRAVETARTVFMSQNFAVESSGHRLTVTGPGMHHNKQNALLGVSEATVSVGRSSIDIDATLGGVRKMQLFLYFFPPALGAFLFLTFFFLGDGSTAGRYAIFLSLAPWMVLSPLLSSHLQKKTKRAVDTLLQNMAG